MFYLKRVEAHSKTSCKTWIGIELFICLRSGDKRNVLHENYYELLELVLVWWLFDFFTAGRQLKFFFYNYLRKAVICLKKSTLLNRVA